MDPLLQSALTYLGGGLSSALPMWIMLRKSNADIRKQNSELALEVQKANLDATKATQETAQQGKIDTEASWKRILDEREKELVLLRAKDDEQEKKLDDLLTRHIECKQNEARQDERSKHTNAQLEKQEKEIRALQNKILSLDRLLRKHHGTDPATGSGTHEPLHFDTLHPQEEARTDSVESVRAGGGSGSGGAGQSG